MTEFLQKINTDYSGVLTLFTSIIMVIVTIIYVAYTKKQAYYAQKSVDAVMTQMKVEKQPCIVPSIIDSHGTAFRTTKSLRMQLRFIVKLDNCGDAPATNIFTFAFIDLQNMKDRNGDNIILIGSLLPDVVHAIMSGQTSTSSLLFETKEIDLLIKDLSATMNKNWEILSTNPSQEHIHGPNLIIKSFYRNIMGQWFTSTLRTEIAWLDYMDKTEKKSNNLNNLIVKEKMKELTKLKEIKSIYEKNILGACKLSPDMLDERGNRDPSEWPSSTEKRGGKNYYPPDSNWVGYGLKVLDQYDNGNNDWIAMDGNANEWAVAYHGTTIKAVKPICEVNGKFFSTIKEGAIGQKCKDFLNANDKSKSLYKICGEGAYASPLLKYANNYAGHGGAIIMCKVK